MNDNVKIMIIDDDFVCREMLSKIVADLNDVEVIGKVSNGRIALTKLKHTPVDMILLDMIMPEFDGIEVLKKLRKDHPDVGVVVVSGIHSSDAAQVVEALQLGALDFLPKLSADAGDSRIREMRLRLTTLLGLVRSRRSLRMAKSEKTINLKTNVASPPKTLTPEDQSTLDIPKPLSLPKTAKIDAVAIGASTGGPNALAELIPKLPGNLGVPVLLVQHMPGSLTASLADSLNKKSILTVKEAVEGEPVLPNTIYMAPGGRHMVVTRDGDSGNGFPRRVIGLNDDPPENSCRPSVDVLFCSLSTAYEAQILTIIMTGMGSDGKKGVENLKQKGCYCLTQTEDTCAVYGMPRSIDEANLSDERVALQDMADRIVSLLNYTGMHR